MTEIEETVKTKDSPSGADTKKITIDKKKIIQVVKVSSDGMDRAAEEIQKYIPSLGSYKGPILVGIILVALAAFIKTPELLVIPMAAVIIGVVAQKNK